MSTTRVHLLNIHATLTPADHQTHRRYAFQVPPHTERLEIKVVYAPKRLEAAASSALAASALRDQARVLASRVGADFADKWQAELTHRAETVRIPNLITISLDDANGVYRGAGHRQAADQTLFIAEAEASPGLVAGALPPGTWTLVVSLHTLVSPECELSIQIGADAPTSTP